MNTMSEFLDQRRAKRVERTQRLTLSCFWYQDPMRILMSLESGEQIRSHHAYHGDNEHTKPLNVNY